MPEQAPERFLVATEACDSGTSDLSSVLEVLGYVGIYGCKGYVGGATGAPRGRGARPGGWARPPPSWTARDSSGPTLLLRRLLLVHKTSSKIGPSIGLHLVFLFYKLKNKEKTETGTGL